MPCPSTVSSEPSGQVFCIVKDLLSETSFAGGHSESLQLASQIAHILPGFEPLIWVSLWTRGAIWPSISSHLPQFQAETNILPVSHLWSQLLQLGGPHGTEKQQYEAGVLNLYP